MRSDPADYEIVAPANLKAAVSLLAEGPGRWLPIAGGTDLMVQYAAGTLRARKLFSIWNLPDLRRVEVFADEIRVGAGCTYTDLREHPVVKIDLPLLARAASWVGGIANQNRGTLGGNIVNASPAADSLPALLAYGADLILVSVRGERRLPYRDFHVGYKKMTACRGRTDPRGMPSSAFCGLRFLRAQGRDAQRAGDLEGVRGGAGAIREWNRSATFASPSGASLRYRSAWWKRNESWMESQLDPSLVLHSSTTRLPRNPPDRRYSLHGPLSLGGDEQSCCGISRKAGRERGMPSGATLDRWNAFLSKRQKKRFCRAAVPKRGLAAWRKRRGRSRMTRPCWPRRTKSGIA